MIKKWQIFIIFFLGIVFLPLSFASAGTILNDYKYSWSDRVGYINFANVIVENSTLSGYAWSKNSGWIKFNPTNGGVFNDGSGNLSGYAWGEQLGWINFDNVSIDTSTGRFSGTATGDLIGTLTFDCPTYCDVRTDWRPNCPTVVNALTYNAYPTCGPATCSSGYTVSGSACVTNGGGGGGGGGFIPAKPKHIETNNQDLTIDPDQSGKYTKDTAEGSIVVEVPTANVSGKTTFYIEIEPLSTDNGYLVLPELQLVNSIFYDVYAKDQVGNFVHQFSSPITITLPVPMDLQLAHDLAVYWLNETNNQWALIPEAVFADNKAVFQVNHLTRFAIFGVIDEENDDKKEPEIDKDKTEKNEEIKESPLKPSLPVSDADTVNNTERDLGQKNIDEQNTKTIIEKTIDFINPIVPGFLKKNKDSERQGLPKDEDGKILAIDNGNQTKQESYSEKQSLCWWWCWIILFVIFFILLLKRHKDKQKEKSLKNK